MKALSLFLFLCGSALAVYHGTASDDDSVVIFFSDWGTAGSGVMLSPGVVITVDHVARGEGFAALKFTNFGDARDVAKIPEARTGHFKAGKTLAPRMIYSGAGAPPRGNGESVTLLLVADADRKKFSGVKFPKLPKAGQKPPDRLRVVGYGETRWAAGGKDPVRGVRNEGSVTNGFSYPQAPYLFETQRGPSNQLTQGGDSGGALRDARYLWGLHLLVLTAPPDAPYLPPSEKKYAGTAFFVAEAEFRAEIDEVMRAWKLIK